MTPPPPKLNISRSMIIPTRYKYSEDIHKVPTAFNIRTIPPPYRHPSPTNKYLKSNHYDIRS